jgi:hypothetical protein
MTAPIVDSDNNPFGSKRPVSSLAYRQQAADLMAQIRYGSRRMISVTTTDSNQSQEQSIHEPTVAASAQASLDLPKEAPPAQAVLDVPSSGRTLSANSAGRSSSASTIPGFVFTSRKASSQPRQVSTQSQSTAVAHSDDGYLGRPQQPRKRTRLSTDPEDVDIEATPRASIQDLPPSELLPASTRVPSATTTTTTGRSPSPTLSAFPLPPSHPRDFAFPGSAPSYPTDTFRDRAGQDLNRYVSSSTAASAATAATSVGSFVKHAGPPAKGPRAITQIRPEDVGALPRQIGSMVFDSREKIWHHARGGKQGSRHGLEDIADGSSDDPFRDIESLREGGEESVARNSRSRLGGRAQEMVYAVEADDTREIAAVGLLSSRSLVQDEHSRMEIDPNSFSIDDADVVPVMTGIEHARQDDIDDSDGTTDDEDGQDFLEMNSFTATQDHHDVGDPDPSSEVEPVHWRGAVAGSSFTVEALPPLPDLPTLPTRTIPVIPPTPVLRPAAKSMSMTPMSVLKTPVRYATPAPRVLTPGHRRSVSFSDGKREGQIRGLGRGEIPMDESDGESEDRSLSALQTGDRSTFVPSARSKRIADMLAMDDDESGTLSSIPSLERSADAYVAFLDSPSKTSSGRSSLHETQLPSQAHGSLRLLNGHVSGRSLSRSQRSMMSGDPSVRKGEATFLTEWSFEVAHDRLVTVITDVQPFKPYWEELDAIELDGKHLDSVARLKEFLPRLDALSMLVTILHEEGSSLIDVLQQLEPAYVLDWCPRNCAHIVGLTQLVRTFVPTHPYAADRPPQPHQRDLIPPPTQSREPRYQQERDRFSAA